MFDFVSIPSKELKEFIENGKVDDLLNDIFKSFWELDTEVQYVLIKRARKVKELISLETLKEVFNCSEETAFEILSNRGNEVYFPIVDIYGNGKVAKAFVIKETSSIITNLPSKLSELKELGENFSVFFDSEFIGNSYMLAVAVGLCCD